MRILCLFGRFAYGDPARGEGYEFVNFLPALGSSGAEVRLFDTFDRSAYRNFADLNSKLVQSVIDFKPDLVFAVLMHYEVWTETLDLIRAHTPAAILHWGTDDSWKYGQFSRFIARHVDLHATTDAYAYAKAREDGLNNVVQSQWAASAELLQPPLPSKECEIDVSFVGAAYGNRKRWVQALRRRGTSVQCFGHGWEAGPIDASRMHTVYRKSRISLNFADSGLQLRRLKLKHSRQIKARTFEVPGAGGLLLTQGAPQLSGCFDIDREVCVFESLDELDAKVANLIANPKLRDEIACAGHQRVRQDHTYASRFPDLIERAMLLAAARGVRSHALRQEHLQPHIMAHDPGCLMNTLAAIVRRVGVGVAGSPRGARAARRVAFEIGHRLVGERVYGARGWPGRMFYAES